MFKITGVNMIEANPNNLLKYGNQYLGIAQITEVEEIEGTEDVKSELSVYPMVDGDDIKLVKLGEDDKHIPNNYVIVLIGETDEDGNRSVSIINSPETMCNLYGLGDDYKDQLSKFLPMLAEDRQLEMVHQTATVNGEPVSTMFFRTKIDVEISSHFNVGDESKAKAVAANLLSAKEYLADYTSHSWIRMFLYTLVKACEDKYNIVHRDDVLEKVAKDIAGITFWNDGEVLTPSVLDIINYMDTIKANIKIK